MLAFASGLPAPKAGDGVGFPGHVPACACGWEAGNARPRPARNVSTAERSKIDASTSWGGPMRETCRLPASVHNSPSAAGVAEHHATPVAHGTRRTRWMISTSRRLHPRPRAALLSSLREAQPRSSLIRTRDYPAAASLRIAGFSWMASALLACRVHERQQPSGCSNCTVGRALLPGQDEEHVACAARGG